MTIGIECHVQLATKTKLFSPANNDSRDAKPNTNVHEIDYGLPGMLPRLNIQAINLAMKAAKALNSDVASVSRFDRKHYFYPDLPSGYQITQMYEPTILAGYVDAPLEDGTFAHVRVHHAHLETDAGKLTHHGDFSLVDLNRAGTPLIEIVSEPDMHSAKEARAYASELHKLMRYAGVTIGDLYHGNMRFDVNVSVAKKGSSTLGTRAEVKNLNSFRSVERAAEYEFERQVDLLRSGEVVVQETRGWNEDTQTTSSQRSKEDAQDYRYMPDPDIPAIHLSQDVISAAQADMPMLPAEYRSKWADLNFDSSVVDELLDSQVSAAAVITVQDKAGQSAAKRVAHWLTSVSQKQNSENDEVHEKHRVPEIDDLIELSGMVEKSELSSTAAKEVFLELARGGSGARSIAVANNLIQLSDESEIAAIVDEVIADPASQKAVEDIRSGNDKAIGYLVGQIMKLSKGKANPALAQKLIRDRL